MFNTFYFLRLQFLVSMYFEIKAPFWVFLENFIIILCKLECVKLASDKIGHFLSKSTELLKLLWLKHWLLEKTSTFYWEGQLRRNVGYDVFNCNFSAIYRETLVPYDLYMKWETIWPNTAKEVTWVQLHQIGAGRKLLKTRSFFYIVQKCSTL